MFVLIPALLFFTFANVITKHDCLGYFYCLCLRAEDYGYLLLVSKLSNTPKRFAVAFKLTVSLSPALLWIPTLDKQPDWAHICWLVPAIWATQPSRYAQKSSDSQPMTWETVGSMTRHKWPANPSSHPMMGYMGSMHRSLCNHTFAARVCLAKLTTNSPRSDARLQYHPLFA
ncbi:hypothetical protein HDV63DRAFT_334568 [Trichoderma sp. SZMC 28014]